MISSVALWITLPGKWAENVTFLARREFTIDQLSETQAVRVTADCRYVLYVNGEKVGAGPAKGSHKRYFYDSYDVVGFLRAGRNHIAAEVHCPGRPTFSAVPVMPALWIEMEGIVGTDTAWQVRPDPSRRNDTPTYTPQLGFSEWRDLRWECMGWQTFADRQEEWMAAVVIGAGSAPGNRLLAARDVPLLTGASQTPARLVSCGKIVVGKEETEDDLKYAERMQSESHLAVPGTVILAAAALRFASADAGSAYCILDFEWESFGTLEFDVEATEGTLLDIGYGDALYDGRVKTFQEPYQFADRYILRGGRQRIDHALHDRGFRYLQLVLRRSRGPVRIEALRVTDRIYPLFTRASFACDDPFLNRLWEMCATTLATCANDTFVDCPWREQAFWVCDTLVVFPFYFSFTGDGILPARCLRLAADGQRENGLIPSVYPSSAVRDSTFPSMSAVWTLMLGDYYRHTGDRTLVCELLPVMDRALMLYEEWAGPDGLVPNQPDMWNFIEWGCPGSRPDAPDNGTTAVLNLLIAAAFKTAASLHRAGGHLEQAARMEKRARNLVGAVTARFWIPERGRFCDGTEGPQTFSQHPHAIGLHYGLLEEPQRSAALEALGDPALVQTDFYYRHFVLNALARGGRGAEALLSIRELWGEMVASGSTTVWETRLGKDEFDGVGSLCHAFACAPLMFMQTTLLGIRPLQPGFAEFAIEPRSLGLRHCHGTVPTPHGLISIAWERQEDRVLHVQAEIPSGTSAMLADGSFLRTGRQTFTLSDRP